MFRTADGPTADHQGPQSDTEIETGYDQTGNIGVKQMRIL